jgi:hypothetical protein
MNIAVAVTRYRYSTAMPASGQQSARNYDLRDT